MKNCVRLITLLLFVTISHAAFRKSPIPMTYEDAMDMCESKEGTLPFILSRKQQQRMIFKMRQENWDKVWIGLNRLKGKPVKKPWDWTFHMMPTFKLLGFFWGPKEPNNYRDHNEQCVEIRLLDKNNETANWNDAPCENLNYFFCDVSSD